MQRVGSDDYGYIDIPKNWLKFRDVNGGDSIQYTDGSGYNIVTMNAYTKEKAKIQEEKSLQLRQLPIVFIIIGKNNKNVNRSLGAQKERLQVTKPIKSML